MNLFKEYHDLVASILNIGNDCIDRTKVGTRSIFGATLTFRTDDGFPILTTKKVNFSTVLHELLWFISGSTNIKYLVDNGINIWNDWADENGDLGPIYGKQWRNWNGIDQLANVIQSIKKDPHSRRHIVSAWNVSEISDMRLPPCHNFFQFYVNKYEKKLDIMVNMRSCDLFLGLPFNISSYATLLKIIAQCCNLYSGRLIINIGDAHIYHNHFDQCEIMLNRNHYSPPELQIEKDIKNVDEFKFEHFKLLNYRHHPFIPAPIAI